jgi:DNA-binding response OmpR family regulator
MWLSICRRYAPALASEQLDDKASGFELGADDYLTKPF